MRLIIDKLIVEGEKYKRTLKFKNGLNVIEGDMGSGKSLLLNLINFMFGKKDKFKENVQKELKKYCDICYLEISIGEQNLTIQRNLWTDTDTIFIYFCDYQKIGNFSPRALSLNEYYEFLFEKLEIPEHKLLKHKRHSQEKEIERLSYRDLMRFVYVNQHDLGTKFFMKQHDNFLRYKNSEMFEVMFQFVEYDESNLTEELAQTTNEIELAKKQIEGLKSYLNEIGIEDKDKLQKKYEDYSNKIDENNKFKKELIYSINSKKGQKDSLYTKTKSIVINLYNDITKLGEQKKDLILAATSKESLLQSYDSEYRELTATKEAYEVLSVDNHTYKCPICSTELPYEAKTTYSIDSINDVILQVSHKRETIIQSIQSTNKKIESIQKDIAELEEEKSIYQKALNKYEEEVDAPYISEIEALNKLLRELQQERDKINECIKIFNKIDEKKLRINELDKKIKELKEKLKELKISEEDRKRVLREVNNKYRGILSNLKLETSISGCYIDESTYVPVYDNASVLEHDSGGILLCMQIAYLTSILIYMKDFESIKHPGFLMFDTVGKYLGTYLQQNNIEYTEDMIMDPLTYQEIYKLFIKVSEYFQVFIVDNIPHVIAKPYTEYTFYHTGLRGLIDIDKNEKVD